MNDQPSPDESLQKHYFDIVHETSPQEQFFQALLDGRVWVQKVRVHEDYGTWQYHIRVDLLDD